MITVLLTQISMNDRPLSCCGVFVSHSLFYFVGSSSCFLLGLSTSCLCPFHTLFSVCTFVFICSTPRVIKSIISPSLLSVSPCQSCIFSLFSSPACVSGASLVSNLFRFSLVLRFAPACFFYFFAACQFHSLDYSFFIKAPLLFFNLPASVVSEFPHLALPKLNSCINYSYEEDYRPVTMENAGSG